MKKSFVLYRNHIATGLLLASASLLTLPAFAVDSNNNQDKSANMENMESSQMKNWSESDLNTIVKADDLHISPFREDGVTYGTPTWIWCVQVNGALYVRAYHGQSSSWYRAAIREKAGRIIAAGMTREVTFEGIPDKELNDQIDAAYKAKYSGSSYLSAMISERARSATVKIYPKSE